MTLSAAGKLQRDKRQKAFQHSGVMQTTLRILWTKREGARCIRRTIMVLAAGIIQIHGLRGNGRIGFFAGMVMAHCGIHA